MFPEAKKDGILTVELPDGEVVLYDATTSRYHQLSATCACVWRSSDGNASPEQIAAIVATTFAVTEARDLVDLALAELSANQLIVPWEGVGEIESGEPQEILSRRDALQRVMARGVAAALLPIVTSLAVPGKAHAHGGGAHGSQISPPSSFSPISFSPPSIPSQGSKGSKGSKGTASSGTGGGFPWWPWS